MNDLHSTLFWLRLAQVIVAIPLFALAGQAATYVLARIMGQPPQQNFIYRLFQIVGVAGGEAVPLDRAPVHSRPPSAARRAFRCCWSPTSGSCSRSRQPARGTGCRSPNACSRNDRTPAALVLEPGRRLVRAVPAPRRRARLLRAHAGARSGGHARARVDRIPVRAAGTESARRSRCSTALSR